MFNNIWQNLCKEQQRKYKLLSFLMETFITLACSSYQATNRELLCHITSP